MNITDISFAVG